MLRSFEDLFLIPEASFPLICLLDGPRPPALLLLLGLAPNILPLGGLRPLVLIFDPLTLRVLEASTLDCHRTLCILPHFLGV